jgi:hypothetical protein
MEKTQEQKQALARTDYAARWNKGKLEWSLVDFDAFIPMVKVLMFGAQKYDAHNWKKGFRYTDILNSLQRHTNALLAGEDNDPESNLPHIGHIQCNAMFLGYMMQFRSDLDDRYKDEFKRAIYNVNINQSDDKISLTMTKENILNHDLH